MSERTGLADEHLDPAGLAMFLGFPQRGYGPFLCCVNQCQHLEHPRLAGIDQPDRTRRREQQSNSLRQPRRSLSQRAQADEPNYENARSGEMGCCPAGSRRPRAGRCSGTRRLGEFVVVAALVLGAGLVASRPASATVRSQPRPTIRLTAGRSQLPVAGGSVVVVLKVTQALRCRFTAPRSVKIGTNWFGCRNGIARRVARFAPNLSSMPVREHVTAWARGAGGLVGSVVLVAEAGRPLPRTPAPTPEGSGAAAPGQSPTPVPMRPPASSSLAVTIGALPDGTVGSPYSAMLAASGGLFPYTWSLAKGSLPSGLALSPNGAIAGTPIAAQAASFTVQVRDSATPAQVATARLWISILPAAFSGATSPNWSGYVIQSSTMVIDASGAWTVPTLDCAETPNAGVAVWVGIGGYGSPAGGSSGPLLQTGVTMSCINGVQQDVAWWEEYPSNPNDAPDFTSLPIMPGDHVQASVYQTLAGAWATRVDDRTAGLSGWMVTGEGWGVSADHSTSYAPQGSTAGLSYPGGYSAEWIVEDYTDSATGALVPFADYGRVSFSSLLTSLASWSLLPSEAIEIDQAGSVLSTPSLPTGDGFSVAYTGQAPAPVPSASAESSASRATSRPDTPRLPAQSSLRQSREGAHHLWQAPVTASRGDQGSSESLMPSASCISAGRRRASRDHEGEPAPK